VSFPRSHRLTKKAEYNALFNKPNKISQPGWLILFKPNKKKHAKLGLIIAKRIINKATQRNTVKRIIRESFRNNKEKLKGFDIIVLIQKQCNKLDKQKLREGINQLWEKLLKRC
jgi:ribonuclease P protein component